MRFFVITPVIRQWIDDGIEQLERYANWGFA